VVAKRVFSAKNKVKHDFNKTLPVIATLSIHYQTIADQKSNVLGAETT
jgi:hypothetical protein